MSSRLEITLNFFDLTREELQDLGYRPRWHFSSSDPDDYSGYEEEDYWEGARWFLWDGFGFRPQYTPESFGCQMSASLNLSRKTINLSFNVTVEPEDKSIGAIWEAVMLKILRESSIHWHYECSEGLGGRTRRIIFDNIIFSKDNLYKIEDLKKRIEETLSQNLSYKMNELCLE